jgi:ATP-dependent DNA helicase RecG
MDKLELFERIAGGEDSFTEFKREIESPDAFAAELIAFANAGGGQIFLGVDDEGKVHGVVDPQRTEEQITNIGRNNCVPPMDLLIEKVDVNGVKVIVVHVPRRLGRPYENKRGQCFIRVGSTKRLASTDERARLLEAAGLFHFEETPVPHTSLDDLDEEAFAEYYQSLLGELLSQAELPLPRILQNMRFLVEDMGGNQRLSVAGLLLFGKHPQELLGWAGITAVRWPGVEMGEELVDRKEMEGRLPQLIDQAETFLVQHTYLSGRIEGFRRQDTPMYPREVLREAVVNAVAHRDYSLSGARIRIFVFANRIEVHSPGSLPNTVTLDNIRTGYSMARNRRILEALLHLGYASRIGSGIPRMIRLMQKYSGQEPDFELRDNLFLVRLWGRTEEGI